MLAFGNGRDLLALTRAAEKHSNDGRKSPPVSIRWNTKDTTSGPETMAQALAWEKVKAAYLRDGLCHACATQAAWGHQVGFAHESHRKWPEADRHIKPPCPACQPVVDTFPLSTVPGSPWRKWPKGDRRPKDAPVALAEAAQMVATAVPGVLGGGPFLPRETEAA